MINQHNDCGHAHRSFGFPAQLQKWDDSMFISVLYRILQYNTFTITRTTDEYQACNQFERMAVQNGRNAAVEYDRFRTK